MEGEFVIRFQPLRATALAGVLGALTMFAGDMLFYGQWGSGADVAANTYSIVAGTSPERLMLGGLLSMPAGLGYLGGALHVFQRLARAGWVLRTATTGAVLSVLIVAVATHAVWGAFALTVASGSRAANALVSHYLDQHFLIGQIIAVPASLLLFGITVSGRTSWPRWVAVFNPGLVYLALATANWFPAPFGAAIVGGAFNLAFAVFFLVSLATARNEDSRDR